MLYPARWKKITVDQSKVLENRLYRLFRFYWATRYTYNYFGFAAVGSKLPLNSTFFWARLCIRSHGRTGPVSFRGAEVNCPNIFSIACPNIKWFCPNITWFFCPKMAIWKILGGGGGPQPPPPPPPPPRTPMSGAVVACGSVDKSTDSQPWASISRRFFCYWGGDDDE